ncbi:MAG: hypothetical protein Q4A19_00205 [Johnsonella sp.]|nr:hypothetical protein [Johnsonella sp.]
MGKKLTALMLPLMGVLFITAYIRSSAVDVVYTDYIRLVNSYLENPYSLKPYLGADIFTRMPITWLQRMINVRFFSYSTFFDMLLGACFLGVSVFIAARYALKKNMEILEIASIVFIGFSLNKWEMLLNGSGWVHFFAFALFYYHYYLYDRYAAKEGKKKDGLRLSLLPWFTILLAAGPYSAVYAASVLPVYALRVFMIWKEGGREKGKKIKRELLLALNLLLPTLLYLLSRANSVEEHAGATRLSIGEVIKADPFLLFRLLLKSLASAGLEPELLKKLGLSSAALMLLGLFMILLYLYALWLNLGKGLYKKTLFPLFLLFSGMASHGLVSLSRWIFLNDSYAMSSRYALQFQAGVIGILLSLYLDKRDCGERGEKKRARPTPIALCIALFFTAGSFWVDAHEIHMSRYRKENFMEKAEAALDFERLSDEELNRIFQYRHDAGRIRKALGILSDRQLNIFAEEKKEALRAE